MLYEALLSRLAERGYRIAIGGMTLPNDASAGLHRALGFEPIGIFRGIGYKHGKWHDVAWTQRALTGSDVPPREPA
jgi:phosphinothricin acetyltransferase